MKNIYVENVTTKMKSGEDIAGGERTLARAYIDSVRKNYEVLVMDNILWEHDVESFVTALRTANISEVYITSQATTSYLDAPRRCRLHQA